MLLALSAQVFGKGLHCAITIREVRMLNWPWNCQGWVVPNDAPLAGGRAVLVNLVQDQGWLAPNHRKPMGESGGNPERLAPVCRELRRDMLPVGWGAWTNVCGNVIDSALDTAHKLPLLWANLEMEASQNPWGRE